MKQFLENAIFGTISLLVYFLFYAAIFFEIIFGRGSTFGQRVMCVVFLIVVSGFVGLAGYGAYRLIF